MSLTVETSQSEIQELRLAADDQSEVQSIVVKAFAETEVGSSEVAEQQLLTIEVQRNTCHYCCSETRDSFEMINPLWFHCAELFGPPLTTTKSHALKQRYPEILQASFSAPK